MEVCVLSSFGRTVVDETRHLLAANTADPAGASGWVDDVEHQCVFAEPVVIHGVRLNGAAHVKFVVAALMSTDVPDVAAVHLAAVALEGVSCCFHLDECVIVRMGGVVVDLVQQNNVGHEDDVSFHLNLI